MSRPNRERGSEIQSPIDMRVYWARPEKTPDLSLDQDRAELFPFIVG